MRMQVQALIRGAKGRPLHDHVPLRRRGRRVRGGARARHARDGARAARSATPCRASSRSGAMLETPSLAFAPDALLRADRLHLDRRQRPQAVLLRRRPRERAGAPALRHAELELPRLPRADRRRAAPRTARRCPSAARMPAGRSRRWPWPRSASGSLSMRPASIGPVKALLRTVDLSPAREVVDAARRSGLPQRAPGARGLAAPGGRRALTRRVFRERMPGGADPVGAAAPASGPAPGLLWAYAADEGGPPVRLAIDEIPAALAGSAWVWINVDLIDQRVHRWIGALCGAIRRTRSWPTGTPASPSSSATARCKGSSPISPWTSCGSPTASTASAFP